MMGIASFQKGTKILIAGVCHTLTRKFDGDYWQVEEDKTGRIKNFHIHDLQKKYKKGELVFVNDNVLNPMDQDYQATMQRSFVQHLNISGKEWERSKMRRQYVLAVKDLPMTESILKPIILDVWNKLGCKETAPHWTTVAKWKRKYIASGNDIFELQAKDHNKGNRNNRYPKDVMDFVNDSIDVIYLTRERKTIEDTLNDAIVKVECENRLRPAEMKLPVPTKSVVKNAIKSIPAFDKHAARYGHLAAVRMFRSVLHRNVLARPLECAEMDHNRLDLFVIDDETGIPWGRPWLTICIDAYSRCILGIHIGFDPPSILTVARCLKHAIMPKVDLQESYPEIDNTWDAHGVMETLIVDNGLEFHSESLEASCNSIGIDLQFTPRKTPWWKGKIERFNGTLNRAVAHGNPGTTFANIFEKDDYNPAEHAVITLGTLKLVVHKWIADVYHQRPHRSLDEVPPAIKWSSTIAIEDINLSQDPARLDAILGKVVQRVLKHEGIEYDSLQYNCKELTNLRLKLGSKLDVELRVDDGDKGYIHVIAPDNSSIIRVPCLDFDYANGITSWHHKLFRRYANHNLDLGDNPTAWRHAKVAVSEIVKRDILKKSTKKTNKAGNARIARFQTSNQKAATGSTKTSHAVNAMPSSASQPVVMPTNPPAMAIAPTQVSIPVFEPIIEDRLVNLKQEQ